MDATMSPLQVPELLQEVAAFVEDLRDLFSFAQIDRFTHAVVTPRLFRCIEFPLDSVESLAVAFRNDPGRAAACRSLSFCRPHAVKIVTAEDTVLLQRWNVDLNTVFSAIAAHGQLASLRWRSPVYKGRGVALSEGVWTTIASALGSLKELDIYIPYTEKHIWTSLARVSFAHLRVFRLSAASAHGWDCALLRQTLDTLYLLEELTLEFPICCGPRGITLGSTHPHLKRFSFTSCSLVEYSNFLARHPGIERLYLETEQPFSSDTDPLSLKMLRALSVDGRSLYFCPTFMDSPIIHLRLREVEMDSEYITDHSCAVMVRAVACTLRCLELDIDFCKDEPPVPPHVTDLLSTAPALAEFAIIRHRPLPLSANWSSDLLTGLLTAIAPVTTLRAVRVRCDEDLAQERLYDLGPLPPRLKYIGWDVGSTSLVYVIERRGDKNFVASTLTRLSTDDWATEGVLPFMGESWTEC